MTVRAKFKVDEINPKDNGGVVRLSPVTCGSEENETFFKYTPWGQITMGTVNAYALAQFEVGMEFYVDFTPSASPAISTGDNAIEQEIQQKGLTAPRVTPGDIEDNIAQEHYFTAADGCAAAYQGGPEFQATSNSCDLLTFCVLVLKNGFTVTGESACASPENFDAALGRKIARHNAVSKLWPLMGYALKQRLHEEK